MSMSEQHRNGEKKTYTLDDHLKYISFGIKDLVKHLDRIATALEKKTDDTKFY